MIGKITFLPEIEPIYYITFQTYDMNKEDSDIYQIVVNGIIPPEMSINLAGLEIRNDHVTVLTGNIKDQSELMGVLNTLSDYHTEVISVKKLDKTGKE